METRRQGKAIGQIEEWQLHEYLQTGFDSLWMDDRLDNGQGMCVHHIDMWRLKPAECFNSWDFESQNFDYCNPKASSTMCLAVHSKAFLDSGAVDVFPPATTTAAPTATNAPLSGMIIYNATNTTTTSTNASNDLVVG
jgi:hypothetical protein